MITSTPESIAEAKRALNDFLRRGRDAAYASPETPQRAFSRETDTDVDIVTETNLERILSEAHASARRYAESRSKNIRPVRQVDESNPSAVEGQAQALDWLKRKGKSRLK